MANVRSLDVAQSATANVMELHNTVASMKKLVKTAKVYVVRRLIQRLKRLRDKRDSEKKISSIAREIEIINGLECDKVSKYALGSTTTFADICKMQDCSLEMKALARLTNNFVIQNKVDEFRKAHNDWQSLALFMMTKQSGRRFRKHKNIKDKQTVIANRQTGDAMITDFVKQKFVGKNVEEIIGRKIASHGKKSDERHTNSDNKTISRKSKKSAETTTDMSKSLFDSNYYENQIGQSINRDEVHNKLSGETITNGKKFLEVCLRKNDVNSKNVGTIENNPKKKDDNYNFDNSDAGVSLGVPTVTVKQMLNDESMLPKNKHENIQQGELIVKMLNLSEMVEDDEVRSFCNENITNVEVGDESDKICTVNNIRDGFFMGGENYAEEDDTEGESYDKYYRETFPNEEVNWKWQNIKSSFVSLKQDQSNENSPMQQTKHLPGNMKFSTQNKREFPHAHIERKKEFGIKSDKYLAVNTGCIYSEDNTADGPSMRTVNLQKISTGKDVEHPSWVASRKRKGETKIGTFRGKKIKFDNSD